MKECRIVIVIVQYATSMVHVGGDLHTIQRTKALVYEDTVKRYVCGYAPTVRHKIMIRLTFVTTTPRYSYSSHNNRF